MNKVRLGIIGMGNIGRQHANYLLQGKVPRCDLTAVCRAAAPSAEGLPRPKVFNDVSEMMHSGEVDAVLIATPQGEHPSLGIAAMERGLHVLVEKPIATHKAEAERFAAAHRRYPNTVFAAMFQMRTEPRWIAIRKLFRDGTLGRIVRVNWIITDWFRTDAYYRSNRWRATWAGEGGGVLMNQAMHNLDLLQWICGQPRRVRGFCQLGRHHDIEVEDDVTAWLEWENGATGVVITSTGEAPGTNRFEIAGTRGRFVLENNRLILTRNATDMAEFSRSATEGFVKPDSAAEEIPAESSVQPHAAISRNFVNAILDGEPLIAPAEEGVQSVELANAMVYSSLTDKVVHLPLDGAVWEKMLGELIAGSLRKHAPSPR